MIVYGSSLSDGHEHSAKNLPLLLAGGAAHDIKPGRQVIRSRDTSMSDLHLAMLHRLGIRRDNFAESKSPFELS
jgi:hypothetical protein